MGNRKQVGQDFTCVMDMDYGYGLLGYGLLGYGTGLLGYGSPVRPALGNRKQVVSTGDG